MTGVASFFGSLVTVLTNLLITPGAAELSPLQILMWAGLVLGFLVFVVGLIKRLTSQS